MSRYDWSWNRSYDRGYRPRPSREYGPDFGPRESAGPYGPGAARGFAGPRGWGGPRGAGAGYGGPGWRGGPGAPWQWESGPGRGWGGPPRPRRQPMRYDRGEYGDFYPTYGGHPGDESRGMYYGGEGSARGYDQGIAREPFLPETAYQRHPELGEPQRHSFDDWPGSAQHAFGGDLSDEEIRSAVRQNLFNDSWIDAARIQVEVSGQVVTLTGEVDDYLEARYAWDDAWEASGVHGVINQLTVRTVAEPATPAEPPTKTPARKTTK